MGVSDGQGVEVCRSDAEGLREQLRASAILGTVLVGTMADSLLAPINEPIEN